MGTLVRSAVHSQGEGHPGTGRKPGCPASRRRSLETAAPIGQPARGPQEPEQDLPPRPQGLCSKKALLTHSAGALALDGFL